MNCCNSTFSYRYIQQTEGLKHERMQAKNKSGIKREKKIFKRKGNYNERKNEGSAKIQTGNPYISIGNSMSTQRRL